MCVCVYVHAWHAIERTRAQEIGGKRDTGNFVTPLWARHKANEQTILRPISGRILSKRENKLAMIPRSFARIASRDRDMQA